MRVFAQHPGPSRTAALHATVAGLAVLCGASSAHAQFVSVFPSPTDNASQLSVNASQFDIGSSFLQRMGREATYGYAARDNSGGGGASQSTAEPQYRTWAETYGNRARTAAQGTFVGDKRGTLGIVGGIGATIAPGLNVGFSVDQSNTWIDVPLALQTATLGMTQLGVNASYSTGPWTVAMAAVHGFAHINSIRTTALGGAVANYRGSIDGVLGEMNYTYGFGQSRIVPKVALEYVSARTDAFAETGGFDPVTVAGGFGERARAGRGRGRPLDHRSAGHRRRLRQVRRQLADIGAVQVSRQQCDQRWASAKAAMAPTQVPPYLDLIRQALPSRRYAAATNPIRV